MRTASAVLFFFTLLSAVVGQQAPKSGYSLTGTAFPVELKTTVKAEKAQPGDVVNFETLAPVLAMKGLVVPTGSRLTGVVISAAAAKDGGPSVLLIQIQRASWKGHVLVLNAYIAGTGMRRELSRNLRDDRCDFYGALQRDQGRSTDAMPQTYTSNAIPADCNRVWVKSGQITAENRAVSLDGILLQKDPRTGATALIGPTRDVHLQKGTMLMLQDISLNRHDEDQSGNLATNH